MSAPLVFGVYPFGVVGGPEGVVSGRPDDFDRIGEALHDLAGEGPPLLVRLYVTFEGSVARALDQVAQFAQLGRLVDLSLNFHDPVGDVDKWCSLVEQVIRQHGSAVGSIGVTNEANLLDVPYAPDGAYPNALEALVDGVLVAADAKRATGSSAAIGFAAATEAAVADRSFWARLTQRGGQTFADAVEFAGLTMYPADFTGAAPSMDEVTARTTEMLSTYRDQLSAVGLPETVPIRICECGWPTGPSRSEAEQAEVLSTIVQTVDRLHDELGISHWALFTLRDADTRRSDAFSQFGILHDDYTPKPAYHALRALIRRYTAPTAYPDHS